MKVFVVLVLAVFTGCQANLFYADEPKPQLEKLTDAFWDYVAKATHTAEDILKTVRESQLGQDINARITEGANVASQYAVTLQKEVSPLAEDILTKIAKETEILKEQLEQDLTTVRDKLEPYAEDLKTQIQQGVEELRVAVAPYAESFDAEALKTILLEKTKEFRRRLKEQVKELESRLQPYAEEFRQKVDQHLQEFQKNVAPLIEVAERAAWVQQSLAPYVRYLSNTLDPYAQHLINQLSSLYKFINTD